MNDQQEQAYLSMSNGKNVFITGGGGVGKTFLIKKFFRDFIVQKNILKTSTTGTSALLIGGNTINSCLGIGIGNGSVDYLVSSIRKKKGKIHLWKTVDVLIIDEVSMLSPELFDKIECIARKIRGNSDPFGGIQLIISGDFCQLPCVGIDKFCFEAKCWNSCIEETHYLTKIFRQRDSVFINLLNEIRLGVVTETTKNILNSRLMVNFDYSNDIKPTMLFSNNREVDSINLRHLEELIRKNKSVFEYDIIFNNKGKIKDSELKFLKLNAPEKVRLTVGCQVMLTVNLDISSGLVNGSRGVVVGFSSEDLPVVKFLNGLEFEIDFHEFVEEDRGEIIFSYFQIPLKLAWCITIHKSQGMTIDYVQTDLRNIFEYGQAYVCLSRIKSLSGLYLLGINYSLIRCNPLALEYYNKLSENTKNDV